jgi:hypothetical protein
MIVSVVIKINILTLRKKLVLVAQRIAVAALETKSVDDVPTIGF